MTKLEVSRDYLSHQLNHDREELARLYDDIAEGAALGAKRLRDGGEPRYVFNIEAVDVVRLVTKIQVTTEALRLLDHARTD